MLSHNCRLAYRGPKKCLCQRRVLFEHAVDRFKRDRRDRCVGDGRDRVQRGFEETCLEPEDLPGQDEIDDLPIAIMKNFVSEQPSVVIEKKRATLPPREHEVLVLVNLPELTAEAPVRIKITPHRCPRRGQMRSREVSSFSGGPNCGVVASCRLTHIADI